MCFLNDLILFGILMRRVSRGSTKSLINSFQAIEYDDSMTFKIEIRGNYTFELFVDVKNILSDYNHCFHEQ